METKIYYSQFISRIKQLKMLKMLSRLRLPLKKSWERDAFIGMVGNKLNFFLPCKNVDGSNAMLRIPIIRKGLSEHFFIENEVRKIILTENFSSVLEENPIYKTAKLSAVDFCNDDGMIYRAEETFDVEEGGLYVSIRPFQ